MPTSMKQLEQRYTDACVNINDTRDYIKTQLFQEVTCYVLSTHKQKRRQLRVDKTKPYRRSNSHAVRLQCCVLPKHSIINIFVINKGVLLNPYQLLIWINMKRF